MGVGIPFEFTCDECEYEPPAFIAKRTIVAKTLPQAVEMARNEGWHVDSHQREYDVPQPDNGPCTIRFTTTELVYEHVVCPHCVKRSEG